MEGTLYLFSAFGITWIALFFYIHSMLRRQKSLERQIEKITEFLEKDQPM
jgi:CcmD family protein